MNPYQDQNKSRHTLIPFEVSKNDSDKLVDLLFDKNQYVLIKNLHEFLGNHSCNYVCRRCLNSHTSQSVLIKQKQQCGEQDITSLILNNEPQLYWKKTFS